MLYNKIIRFHSQGKSQKSLKKYLKGHFPIIDSLFPFYYKTLNRRQHNMLFTVISALLFSVLCSELQATQPVSAVMPKTDCVYPQWPSPSTMYGTYVAGHDYGTIKFCYDGARNIYTKIFNSTVSNYVKIGVFNDTRFYFQCMGPNKCGKSATTPVGTCRLTVMPQFPFPMNQFENYTIVGQEVVHENPAIHWVGTNVGYAAGEPFAMDQYMDVDNPCVSNIGNIIIDEPRASGTPVTEIRWFDKVYDEVDEHCFDILPSCLNLTVEHPGILFNLSCFMDYAYTIK